MPRYLNDGGSHIDAPLSRMAVRAFDGGGDFVAGELFPRVPVSKQSDGYWILDPASWLQNHDTHRTPKTEAKRGEWKASTETYFCDNYAFGTDYARETLANADMALQIRENGVQFVTEVLRRDREIRVAHQVTSISNVGSGVALAGAAKWSNTSSSDPVSDVRTAHAFIRGRTGLKANVAVVDYDTMETLRYHSGVKAQWIGTDKDGPVPDEWLARLFRVDRFLIAQGIYNTAAEGESSSLINIWGNCFLLARVQPGVSLQTATMGLQFSWTPEGFPAPMAVERFDHYNPSVKAEILEAQYFGDEKIIARDLSYLINETL